MLDIYTVSDIEILEETYSEFEVTCEHTRHPMDPAWHDEGNGMYDVILFCTGCEPRPVVFCSGYVQKRIMLYPYDVVWCPVCKGRSPINQSYQVIGRID